MSPRPRSDNSKRNQYRLRMSDEELKKLEFCCEKLLLTKSEVIRSGLDAMYQKSPKEVETACRRPSTQTVSSHPNQQKG